MKRIRASAFKSHCLEVIKNVQTTGEPVIVTKHGKPVVKVIPTEPEEGDILGFMAGEFEIVGDIEAPIISRKELMDFNEDQPRSGRAHCFRDCRGNR